MAESNIRNTGGGMGLLGWLFIVFLILKLNPGGHLDTPIKNWSWWWVTAPLWGPLAVAAVFGFIAFVVWGCLRLTESKQDKNIRKSKSALKDYTRTLRR